MAQDCTKPRKEKGRNYGQAVEDAQIQIKIAEEETYSDVKVFDMLLIGVV